MITVLSYVLTFAAGAVSLCAAVYAAGWWLADGSDECEEDKPK